MTPTNDLIERLRARAADPDRRTFAGARSREREIGGHLGFDEDEIGPT